MPTSKQIKEKSQNGSKQFRANFLCPKFEGLNSILSGLLYDLTWKFGSFGSELQNNLFYTPPVGNDVPKQLAVDLFATNIVRGRDHGLAPYLSYVQSCLNITTIKNFSDLAVLMNGQNWGRLASLYEYISLTFL